MNPRGRQRIAFAALLAALLPAGAAARNAEEESPVDIHMLVSQGFVLSTANDYLANSDPGSFEFSEVALNFTWRLDDSLRTGLQLFTRDLGPLGDYRARFDWFFLDWHRFDWLNVRAGRVKLPFGLYNELSATTRVAWPSCCRSPRIPSRSATSSWRAPGWQ